VEAAAEAARRRERDTRHIDIGSVSVPLGLPLSLSLSSQMLRVVAWWVDGKHGR
jgi:hypothetical protein